MSSSFTCLMEAAPSRKNSQPQIHKSLEHADFW
jgi:hypothetical protein